MRLYEYQGAETTLPLANGETLTLEPGAHVELEPTPTIRMLVRQGLLLELKRDSKPAKSRRRRRRQLRKIYSGARSE